MSRFGFGHFPTVSVEDPYVPEPVTFLLTLLRKQCKNNCSVPGLVNVNMNTVNAFRRKKISIHYADISWLIRTEPLLGTASIH